MPHTGQGGNLTHLVGHYSALIALIGFGSIVHAVIQYNDARINGRTFRVLDFIAALIIAGFSGLMFSLSAAFFTENALAVYWLGGVGSFLGLKGVNKITDIGLEFLSRQARK